MFAILWPVCSLFWGIFPLFPRTLLPCCCRFVDQPLVVSCFQGQACVLVLRAMQSREVQKLLSGEPWTELCDKIAGQLTMVRQRYSTLALSMSNGYNTEFDTDLCHSSDTGNRTLPERVSSTFYSILSINGHHHIIPSSNIYRVFNWVRNKCQLEAQFAQKNQFLLRKRVWQMMSSFRSTLTRH